MSSIEDTWPLPNYNGPPEHVHAIGHIALTYAALQGAMDDLFLDTADSAWAEKYYYLLSEENRSGAIKTIFEDDDPAVVEAIGNLVEYFDWGRLCRNNLLHAESHLTGLIPGGAFGLTKRLKKGSSEYGYMAMTLEDLRDVADRMQDGVQQCLKIHLFLGHRRRPEELDEKYQEYAKSLPAKLSIPKPIALAPRPQDLRGGG